MERRHSVNEPCCISSADYEERAQRCPASGGEGQSVRWTTLAALANGPIPERQRVWLCPDADCELVYFGEHGLRLSLADVRVAPGKKIGGSGLACYCFEYSRQTIEDEVHGLGSSPTAEGIRREVQAKNCACEVRNPTGKCCLSEIDALVRETVKGAL